MAPDIDQRAFLVVQLELHLANVPRVFAAAILEILDRDFDNRRRLIAAQVTEIQIRIAVAADAYVIGHIGEAEQRQLLQHHVNGDSGALGAPGLRLGNGFGNVRF